MKIYITGYAMYFSQHPSEGRQKIFSDSRGVYRSEYIGILSII